MRKLIIAGLVVSAVALSPENPEARNRATRIHFTRNLNTMLYPAECIGVVATETLPALRGDNMLWKAVNGNGHNNDDLCPGFDKKEVELRFKTDVMGAAAVKVLKAEMNGSGLVKGIISTVATESPATPHHYQVFYKGLAAGPDPEIDVECGSCGPGGGGGN